MGSLYVLIDRVDYKIFIEKKFDCKSKAEVNPASCINKNFYKTHNNIEDGSDHEAETLRH